MDEFVLLLQEVPYHPRSYLTKLNKKFEVTSIVNIRGRDEIRKYTKPPIFDDKYLVIFEDVKLFVESKSFLSFKSMFPVLHVETRAQLEDAEFACKEFNIPYKVFRNQFTREDAFALIQSNASQPVSDSVCKAIVRQVGLSPLRVLTAVGVCEQLGYSVSTVERYLDKWIYPDVRKLIECLLGVPRSKSAVRSSLVYLHLNRHWYRYVKSTILNELDVVLKVYRDKIEGKLGHDQMFNYIEAEKITRARVMFALNLFEHVGISVVFALREFLKSASLMEVVIQLDQLLGGM